MIQKPRWKLSEEEERNRQRELKAIIENRPRWIWNAIGVGIQLLTLVFVSWSYSQTFAPLTKVEYQNERMKEERVSLQQKLDELTSLEVSLQGKVGKLEDTKTALTADVDELSKSKTELEDIYFQYELQKFSISISRNMSWIYFGNGRTGSGLYLYGIDGDVDSEKISNYINGLRSRWPNFQNELDETLKNAKSSIGNSKLRQSLFKRFETWVSSNRHRFQCDFPEEKAKEYLNKEVNWETEVQNRVEQQNEKRLSKLKEKYGENIRIESDEESEQWNKRLLRQDITYEIYSPFFNELDELIERCTESRRNLLREFQNMMLPDGYNKVFLYQWDD